ncbi:MAG: tetratricopeptide repeat protein [Mucilaginibacter sp.]|nr:tetratricopeptide repeat protein [Mucilaginibacter sp.]
MPSNIYFCQVKKQTYRFYIFLMLIACTITYSNHFQNGFHFDDSHTIENNAYIRNIHNISLFFTDGSTSSALPQNQAYRPLVTTSLAFDYWIGGGYYYFFFHLSSFILFLIQGVLMAGFMRKLFNISVPGDDSTNAFIAIIAATLYLVHPAIAETVNYVIARSDLQSTFAVVVAFALYQYSAVSRKFYLYLIPVIIGAFAKPPSIMFAPIFLFYLLLFEEQLGIVDIFKPSRFKQVFSVIKNTIPSFIVSICMYLLIDKLTPKSWQPGGTAPLQYLITQPFVIAHYFCMFFVPNALSADSDWGLIAGISDWRFFVGSAFILAMVIIAIITSQKKLLRPISFGILWFFLALVPSSSIIPLGEVLNDHRMYFPFVGLVISVSWTIALIAKKLAPIISKYMPAYKKAFAVLLGLVLIIYAYGTWQRNEVWHDEESLWHDVTIKSPNNGRGLMNYGLTKMAGGDYITADIYYQRALKLLPNYFSLYINIAILKAATGHTEEAETYFKKGLWLGSAYPDSYIFYARFLNSQGHYPEAIINLQKAISLSAGDLFAHSLLMEAYQNTDNWDELKKEALATLQLAPDNADAKSYLEAAKNKNSKIAIEAQKVKAAPTAEKYLTLSLLYYNAGQFQQCIEAGNEAIKLKSNFPEAYNNICASYNKLQQWDKAVTAGKKGLALSPNFQLLKNNLQEAYSHTKK